MSESSIPPVTILLDPMDLVVPVGEELSLAVMGSRPIAAGTFQVTSDASLVSIVRTDPGPGAGADFQAHTRQGAVAVNFRGASLADGLICTIVLKADAPGSSVLRVIDARANDADGKPLPVESLSASVRILGPEDDSI